MRAGTTPTTRGKINTILTTKIIMQLNDKSKSCIDLTPPVRIVQCCRGLQRQNEEGGRQHNMFVPNCHGVYIFAMSVDTLIRRIIYTAIYRQWHLHKHTCIQACAMHGECLLCLLCLMNVFLIFLVVIYNAWSRPAHRAGTTPIADR